MSKYVLSFRSQAGKTPTGDEEAAWGAWFGQIGASIADFGSRVGQSRALGSSATGAGPAGTVLSGYVVVSADNLDAAVGIAEGCPALVQGGGVEVGEAVAPTGEPLEE